MVGNFWNLPLIERIVDFEIQGEIFEAVLSKKYRSNLFLIEAPERRGKTSLCERLRKIAKDYLTITLKIDFIKPERHDSLSVLQLIAGAVGDSGNFSTLTNLLFPPHLINGGVNFGSHNFFISSNFENVVGGNQYCQLDTSDLIIQRRITSAFLTDWRKLDIHPYVLVLIIDTYEKCLPPTQTWLSEIFLPDFITVDINKPIVILAGRTLPKDILNAETEHLVYRYDLPPLDLKHYKEYIEKTGITIEDDKIQFLYRMTKGDPSWMELALRNIYS